MKNEGRKEGGRREKGLVVLHLLVLLDDGACEK